jgi:O-antigen/teichoic acid export membrane protein
MTGPALDGHAPLSLTRTTAPLRLRGVISLVFAHGAGAASSLAGAVILARTLGAEGKGTVNFLQTATALAAMALCMAMPGISGYVSAKGLCSARQTWFFIVGAAAMGTAIASLIVALGAGALSHWIGAPAPSLLWLIILAVPPNLIVTGTFSILIGRSRSREAAILQGTLAVAPVLCWALSNATGRLTVQGAITWWILTQYLTAITGSYIVLRLHRGPTLSGPSFGRALSLAAPYGLSSWLAGGIQLLVLRADVILLSRLAGIDSVGVYLLGVSLSELSWYLPYALYNILFPQIAVGGAQSGSFVAQTARRMLPLVLLTSSLTYVAARQLVVPIFGPRFADASLVCGLLIPGITAGALPYLWSSFLAGIDRPWLSTFASSANLVTNVVACILLIPRFGIAGAALASSISYVVGSAIMVSVFSKAAGVTIRETLVPTMSDLGALRNALTALLRPGTREV